MIEGYKVLDSQGYTSTVYYLPGDPPRACKSFNEDCIKTHFPVEKEAYERFSAHNHPFSILKYSGIHDRISAGIVLELAEKKSLYEYRWRQKQSVNPDPDLELEVLYRWAVSLGWASRGGLGIRSLSGRVQL